MRQANLAQIAAVVSANNSLGDCGLTFVKYISGLSDKASKILNELCQIAVAGI